MLSIKLRYKLYFSFSIPTPGVPHFYYMLGANLGLLLYGEVSVMYSKCISLKLLLLTVPYMLRGNKKYTVFLFEYSDLCKWLCQKCFYCHLVQRLVLHKYLVLMSLSKTISLYQNHPPNGFKLNTKFYMSQMTPL